MTLAAGNNLKDSSSWEKPLDLVQLMKLEGVLSSVRELKYGIRPSGFGGEFEVTGKITATAKTIIVAFAQNCNGREPSTSLEDRASPVIIIKGSTAARLIFGDELGDNADLDVLLSAGCFPLDYRDPGKRKILFRAGLASMLASLDPSGAYRGEDILLENFFEIPGRGSFLISFAGIDFVIPIPNFTDAVQISSSTALHDSMRITIPILLKTLDMEQALASSEFSEFSYDQIRKAYLNKELIMPFLELVYNLLGRTAFSCTKGFAYSCDEIKSFFRNITKEICENKLANLKKLIAKKCVSPEQRLIFFINAFCLIPKRDDIISYFDDFLRSDGFIQSLPQWLKSSFSEGKVSEIFEYLNFCGSLGFFPIDTGGQMGFTPIKDLMIRPHVRGDALFCKMEEESQFYLTIRPLEIRSIAACFLKYKGLFTKDQKSFFYLRFVELILKNRSLKTFEECLLEVVDFAMEIGISHPISHIIQSIESHEDFKAYLVDQMPYILNLYRDGSKTCSGDKLYEKEFLRDNLLKSLEASNFIYFKGVTLLLDLPYIAEIFNEAQEPLLKILSIQKSHFDSINIKDWIAFYLKKDAFSQKELYFLLFVATCMKDTACENVIFESFINRLFLKLKDLTKNEAQLNNYRKIIEKALSRLNPDSLPPELFLEAVDLGISPPKTALLISKVYKLDQKKLYKLCEQISKYEAILSDSEFQMLIEIAKRDSKVYDFLLSHITKHAHSEACYIAFYDFIIREKKAEAAEVIRFYVSHFDSDILLHKWIETKKPSTESIVRLLSECSEKLKPKIKDFLILYVISIYKLNEKSIFPTLANILLDQIEISQSKNSIFVFLAKNHLFLSDGQCSNFLESLFRAEPNEEVFVLLLDLLAKMNNKSFFKQQKIQADFELFVLNLFTRIDSKTTISSEEFTYLLNFLFVHREIVGFTKISLIFKKIFSLKPPVTTSLRDKELLNSLNIWLISNIAKLDFDFFPCFFDNFITILHVVPKAEIERNILDLATNLNKFENKKFLTALVLHPDLFIEHVNLSLPSNEKKLVNFLLSIGKSFEEDSKEIPNWVLNFIFLFISTEQMDDICDVFLISYFSPINKSSVKKIQESISPLAIRSINFIHFLLRLSNSALTNQERLLVNDLIFNRDSKALRVALSETQEESLKKLILLFAPTSEGEMVALINWIEVFLENIPGVSKSAVLKDFSLKLSEYVIGLHAFFIPLIPKIQSFSRELLQLTASCLFHYSDKIAYYINIEQPEELSALLALYDPTVGDLKDSQKLLYQNLILLNIDRLLSSIEPENSVIIKGNLQAIHRIFDLYHHFDTEESPCKRYLQRTCLKAFFIKIYELTKEKKIEEIFCLELVKKLLESENSRLVYFNSAEGETASKYYEASIELYDQILRCIEEYCPPSDKVDVLDDLLVNFILLNSSLEDLNSYMLIMNPKTSEVARRISNQYFRETSCQRALFGSFWQWVISCNEVNNIVAFEPFTTEFVLFPAVVALVKEHYHAFLTEYDSSICKVEAGDKEDKVDLDIVRENLTSTLKSLLLVLGISFRSPHPETCLIEFMKPPLLEMINSLEYRIMTTRALDLLVRLEKPSAHLLSCLINLNPELEFKEGDYAYLFEYYTKVLIDYREIDPKILESLIRSFCHVFHKWNKEILANLPDDFSIKNHQYLVRFAEGLNFIPKAARIDIFKILISDMVDKSNRKLFYISYLQLFSYALNEIDQKDKLEIISYEELSSYFKFLSGFPEFREEKFHNIACELAILIWSSS